MKREVSFPLFAVIAVFMLFSPASSQARTMHTMHKKMQAATNSSSATAVKGRHEAMRMVPAQAVLKNNINARNMRAGDKFQATLNKTVHLKNGPELPRGTQLIGTVSTDKMEAGGTSTLALRFTQATLKDGKVVPIKATIVDVAPPANPYYPGTFNSASNYWNDKMLRVTQIGAESGVNLHSAIASRNSGVFEAAKKDNVKLPAQARLSLAIAARKAARLHKMALRHSKMKSRS